MTRPAVSIIIPCYNQAHYLPSVVRCLQAQTMKDWEAIIVDDGSTDNTAEVAASFDDPRVRIVHQENRGLAGARNSGIEAAAGCFFAFVDADDEWAPEFLAECLEALEQNPEAPAAYTRVTFIDESGNVLPQIGGETLSGPAFRQRLLEGGFFTPNSILVRAAAMRSVGIFDRAAWGVEDWDMWLRLSERAPFVGLSAPLARYRVYPSSMSTNTEGMHGGRMAVLAKHFGPAEGDPKEWSANKRKVYAFAYRTTAYGYAQQADLDKAWFWLGRASELMPELLERTDTYYELALADQPRGHRGQVQGMDLRPCADALVARIAPLLEETPGVTPALKRAAWGNAYLALGMLADQAGDWPLARTYLLRAASYNRALLKDPAFIRRLTKLTAGKTLANAARRRSS